MSEEDNFNQEEVEDEEEIDEDQIYAQMYEAIEEELHRESGEEEDDTPNLDELNLSPEEIESVKLGGLVTFKQIMQSRFKQSSENDPEVDQISTQFKEGLQISQNHQIISSEQPQNHIQDSEYHSIDIHQSQPSKPNNNNNTAYMEEFQFEGAQEQELDNSKYQPINQQQNRLQVGQQTHYQSNRTTNVNNSLSPSQTNNNINKSNSPPGQVKVAQKQMNLSSNSPLDNYDPIFSESQYENRQASSEYSDSQYKQPIKGASKKKQPIVTDVFSLSGVKVSQYKTISQLNSGSTSSLEGAYMKQPRSSIGSTMSFLDSGVNSRTQKKQEEAINSLFRRHNEVQEKIQKRQIEKQIQEESMLKSKNLMTKVSKSIIANLGYLKPEERAAHIQRETQEKRKLMLEEKKRQEMELEIQKCTFHPQILTDHTSSTQTRSYDEFFQQQKDWQKNKQQIITSSQEEKARREMEGLRKDSRQEKRMVEDNQPLFRPVILPKSQELAQKRKEKQQQNIISLTASTSSKYI